MASNFVVILNPFYENTKNLEFLIDIYSKKGGDDVYNDNNGYHAICIDHC
jgi:hypothetical protein